MVVKYDVGSIERRTTSVFYELWKIGIKSARETALAGDEEWVHGAGNIASLKTHETFRFNESIAIGGDIVVCVQEALGVRCRSAE